MNRIGQLSIFFMLCSLLIVSTKNNSLGNLRLIPDPIAMGNVLREDFNDMDRGTWFVGASPDCVEESKSPIVFIQGLTGSAREWWDLTEYHGNNDMYRLAYENGYRTGFIQLYDASRGALNPWNNGKVIADALEKIYNHFGEKVNIVAHSKGGIDTEVALTEHGAYRFVGKVITVGSPHWGSPIANLFSSWYGKNLVILLDSHGDGTKEGLRSLQTGSMAQFRSEMDTHRHIDKNRYYTASGVNWGPRFSLLWCAGLYLSCFGDNDGMVNEQSTHLSYAKHLFTLDMDHDQLRKGSAIFDKIEPVLREKEDSVNEVRTDMVPLQECKASSFPVTAPSSAQMGADYFIYGGRLDPGVHEKKAIWVDGSQQALFTVFTKSEDADVSLCSPSGICYTKKSKQYISGRNRSMYLNEAMHSYVIPTPEQGVWKITMVSSHKDAYLLMTTLSGKQSYSVDVPSVIQSQYAPVTITSLDQVNSPVQIEMKVMDPDQKMTCRSLREQVNNRSDSRKATLFQGKVHIGSKKGVYNILFEITRKTKEGITVERTISRSIYQK